MKFLLRTYPLDQDAPVEFALLELEKPMIGALFDRAKTLKEARIDHPDLLEMSYRNFHCRFFHERGLEKRIVQALGQEKWDELYESLMDEESFEFKEEIFEKSDFCDEGMYSYLYVSIDNSTQAPYIYFMAQCEDFSMDITTATVYLRDLEKYL